MGKTKDRLAQVKQKFKDKSFEDPPPVDLETKTALEVGFAYERILGEYVHKPALRFFVNMGREGIKPITLGHLRKAAKIVINKKVDAETYVRAQFYWFHKWFRKPPKIRELISSGRKHSAEWRLTEFLKLDKNTRVYSIVLPSTEISNEKLDKINQERLEQLAIAWDRSHSEILQMFGASGVFDQGWLDQNKEYLRLKRSGKI